MLSYVKQFFDLVNTTTTQSAFFILGLVICYSLMLVSQISPRTSVLVHNQESEMALQSMQFKEQWFSC